MSAERKRLVKELARRAGEFEAHPDERLTEGAYYLALHHLVRFEGWLDIGRPPENNRLLGDQTQEPKAHAAEAAEVCALETSGVGP